MRRLLYVALCMATTVAAFVVPSRAPALTRGVGLLKQRVEFTVTRGDKGPRAEQVRPI